VVFLVVMTVGLSRAIVEGLYICQELGATEQNRTHCQKKTTSASRQIMNYERRTRVHKLTSEHQVPSESW